MRLPVFLMLALIVGASAIYAEDLIGTANTTNTTLTDNTINSPWDASSKPCIFLREWILKGVFAVIFLVFVLGVAVMSGAAFPNWREKGGMMILCSIGAAILYVIGVPALKFLMGYSVCGL